MEKIIEDQEELLEKSRKIVKENAFFMRQKLELLNLREGLQYAYRMLQQLANPGFSPRTYFELWMQIFDELRNLELFFRQEYKRGRKMSQLYEAVQHCEELIPRLYLLITVGSVYIQTFEVKPREILSDLLEMLKSVQNPLRGLFLRYYFLKMCKDRLPDTGNEYDGEGGNVYDSITCIINNLAEMNKLWMRIQGSELLVQERIHLKVTIGENITRLSNLEGVNIFVYKEQVLPKLIELILHCEDVISQQYLVDCIIQAFPDENHLNNLTVLLEMITQKLELGVDIKTIFISLMNRLANFAKINEGKVYLEGNSEQNMYAMFKKHIDHILNQNYVNQSLEILFDLQSAFINFTIGIYPKELEYINEILSQCCVLCEKIMNLSPSILNNIVKFLTIPLEGMSIDILTVHQYPNLMQYLPFLERRQVANKICEAVLKLGQPLSKKSDVEQLLLFLNPLLVSGQEYQENDQNDFILEQKKISKLVHLVKNENDLETIEILNEFKKKFTSGGIQRMKYTIPSLVYEYLKLIPKLATIESFNMEEFIEELKDITSKIIEEVPLLVMKLNVNIVLAVNLFDKTKKYDELCYDIFCDALQIYEENVGDNEQKISYLNFFIGSLEKISCLGNDNYDSLIQNTTQYSVKLLKKSDQCDILLKCTHLFCNSQYQNEQRLLEVFKRTLKFAGLSLKQSISNIRLYVQILNKFFYFLSKFKLDSFDSNNISECIKLIKSKIGDLGSSALDLRIKQYWENTQKFILKQKSKGIQLFQSIEL